MQSYLNDKVIVIVGDITKQKTDAIVNAANSSLLGGGGVDGAIHFIGGPKILEECKEIRKNKYPQGLPPGQAVTTSGGNLPAKYVIHTVGPVWHNGNSNEDKVLEDAYLNSLKETENLFCKSVSFPAISTGIYGFPGDRSAQIVSNTLKKYFQNNKNTLIEKVYLVFYSERDYGIFIDNQNFL